jgi:hypothetical protein
MTRPYDMAYATTLATKHWTEIYGDDNGDGYLTIEEVPQEYKAFIQVFM